MHEFRYIANFVLATTGRSPFYQQPLLTHF